MKEQTLTALIDTLRQTRTLSDAELSRLYHEGTPETDAYLYAQADAVRREVYGNAVYLRGLIEISNICKNDCLYCGIRRSNGAASRYRLTLEDLLACCEHGYALGFRTFVLQGGEDAFFTDEVLAEWVGAVHARFPDCAITLSLGERSRESYARLYKAGARRYLLRHETATASHYAKLHPPEMSLAHRLQCLDDLRDLGYQTGCGIMVGSPYQTWDNLLALYAKVRSADGGHWPLHPCEGHAVCRRACWQSARHALAARCGAARAAAGAPACDDGAGDARSKGSRSRAARWRKCAHAKSFAAFCAKEICPL